MGTGSCKSVNIKDKRGQIPRGHTGGWGSGGMQDYARDRAEEIEMEVEMEVDGGRRGGYKKTPVFRRFLREGNAKNANVRLSEYLDVWRICGDYLGRPTLGTEAASVPVVPEVAGLFLLSSAMSSSVMS